MEYLTPAWAPKFIIHDISGSKKGILDLTHTRLFTIKTKNARNYLY